MSWSNFLLILGICYLAYYGFNFLFDLFGKPKNKQQSVGDSVLMFTETVVPLDIEEESNQNREEVITNVLNKEKEVIQEQSPIQVTEIEAEPTAVPYTEQVNESIVVKNTSIIDEPQLIPPKVNVEVSAESGGLDLKSLFALCREDAILQSSKINFA